MDVNVLNKIILMQKDIDFMMGFIQEKGLYEDYVKLIREKYDHCELILNTYFDKNKR